MGKNKRVKYTYDLIVNMYELPNAPEEGSVPEYTERQLNNEIRNGNRLKFYLGFLTLIAMTYLGIKDMKLSNEISLLKETARLGAVKAQIDSDQRWSRFMSNESQHCLTDKLE